MAAVNKRKERLLNEFLLGCDPEFVALTRDGNLINAETYLDSDGEVGTDHGGFVIELRPKPARGTYALIKRLQHYFHEGELPDFVEASGASLLRAGAWVNAKNRHIPLGGHIHIGIGMSYVQSQKQAERVQALDALTNVLERLDILPTRESQTRRQNGHYGQYGDVRGSGNPPHMEYRSMSSWLHAPAVAMVCLTGAKLAAVDPEGTKTKLQSGTAEFADLKSWFEQYQTKDTNARRVCEKILAKGHKPLVMAPDGDVRERWAELGC